MKYSIFTSSVSLEIRKPFSLKVSVSGSEINSSAPNFAYLYSSMYLSRKPNCKAERSSSIKNGKKRALEAQRKTVQSRILFHTRRLTSKMESKTIITNTDLAGMKNRSACKVSIKCQFF